MPRVTRDNTHTNATTIKNTTTQPTTATNMCDRDSHRMMRSVPLCVSSSNTSLTPFNTCRNSANLNVSLTLGSTSA